MILDEPTSSLDPVSEVQIVELLKELSQSRKLIVIAHRLTTISGADLIVFLKDGRLRELGSHNELMGLSNGYYRRYVEKQIY